jgi:hypothetical protein
MDMDMDMDMDMELWYRLHGTDAHGRSDHIDGTVA